MPRVSVVIPSYNHARYLARRFESVLGQTYRDFEVIFLDDASTDDSLAVFEPYRGHPAVRAVVNEANSGSPFVQWNRGVREARGEFVWLAESDDCCEPTFLERLVAVLDAHPSVGLAYTNSRIVDEAGRLVARFDEWIAGLHPTRWRADFVADGPDECRRYLAVRNTVPNASSVVFRRELYDRVGGADESVRLCGDWAVWAKLLAAADVAYLADPLNHFRAPHAESQRVRTAGRPTLVVERLAVLRQIDAAVGLPPDLLDRATAAVADDWLTVLRDADPAQVAACCGPVVRAAASAGPDWTLNLMCAALSSAVRVPGGDPVRKTVDVMWGNVDRIDGRLTATERTVARVDHALDGVGATVRQLQQAVAQMQANRSVWARLRSRVRPAGGWLWRAAGELFRLPTSVGRR